MRTPATYDPRFVTLAGCWLTASDRTATIRAVPSNQISRRTFGAVVMAVGASCRRGPDRPGRDRPLVVVLGSLYAPRAREMLRVHLARTSGLQIELRVAESSSRAIDMVQAGRADAGLLPLFDFLFCAEVFGVVPLVQVLRAGERATQAGEFVVRDDSPLRELQDLRGRRVGYVDRYSVTGFLLPAAHVREASVSVEPVWLGTHEAAIAAVRDGRVAAGATYSGHAASEMGLRVLASTGAIANEPVFVQASMPAEVREALRGALLAEHDPDLLAGLAGITHFRVPPTGTYAAALARVRVAGERVEDIVPGGWSRANDHRRPLWSYAP